MESYKSKSSTNNCVYLQQILYFKDFNINYNIKIFHSFIKKLFFSQKFYFQSFLLVLLFGNHFLGSLYIWRKVFFLFHTFFILKIVLRKLIGHE